MATPSLHSVLHAAAKIDGLACFDTGHGDTVVTWGSGPTHKTVDGWQQFVREHTLTHPQSDGPYTGGVVGWLGYEAGGSVECMPAPIGPRPTHDVCLWRTDGALLLRQGTQEWSIHGSNAFQKRALDLLDNARNSDGIAQPLQNPTSPTQPKPAQGVRFQAGVQRILDHIRSGEVYQVSYAWEHAPMPIENAWAVWLLLREKNPALRGCYLRSSGTEIISNSPELFLEYDAKARLAVSTPIKGTAPWSEDPRSKEELKHSPKEKAELTMIVDLVRNDLGRVAEPGSVVAGDRYIRKCGDLWHAEQSVTASIKRPHDAVDLVASAFPPGSVTGAPKVRAMKVIAELEDGPRGVYTGTIGWFADGGGAHLNVAIRTATVVDGQARFHVGAGIVADSSPSQEWAETLAKAGALSEALNA